MPPSKPLPSLPDLTPAVGDVLTAVRDAVVAATSPLLVGLYLSGSLVAGDFDPDVSDLDLIAVLAQEPSEELGTCLQAMHADLANRLPSWDGRIEVVYVGAEDLRHWRVGIRRMAVISPGEPFHLVSGGPDWVLTWYPARQQGLALVGPPIAAILPPIPRQEYVAAVRRHIRRFGERIGDDASRAAQAYAILTVCRGLNTIRIGERLSKRQAAAWAAREYPAWADLIEAALTWRAGQWAAENQDATATVGATRRFLAALAPPEAG